MAYTNKTSIEQYMGITISLSLTDFVNALIAAATEFIEQTCGDETFGPRVFEAPDPDNAIDRVFDGNDSTRLYIGDLREIVSLTIDGNPYTQTTDYLLYPANLSPKLWIELIQPAGAVNSRLSRAGTYTFTGGQQNVVISAKWGYSAAVPAAITIATNKLVAAMIKENIGDKDVREVTSETLGDYSVTFQALQKVADALKVTDILAPYMRSKKVPRAGTIVV